jgi:hypothetical protein
MTTNITKILAAALMAISLAGCTASREPVTFGTLLEDMTNPEILTALPEPSFNCRQFSSYDRRTKTPGGEGWFANHDASWFVGQETNEGRREFVMLDAEGPGAVVRFWMTFGNQAAYTGTLRFYFDGQDKPGIEGPVLEIISGGKIVGEPLSSSVSPKTAYAQRGHNLYMPIPYSKHLKITYECPALDPEKHSPSVYYNINYRTYDPGTKVETFTMQDLQTYKDVLEKTQQALISRLPNTGQDLTSSNVCEPSGKVLMPGETATLKVKGAFAIQELTFRIEAENQPQAYRSTVLQITFDGERTVWSPIGDFFGTGYQLRPYKTFHTAALEDGSLKSFWLMPFRKEAVVEIINYGDQPVKILESNVLTGEYRWTSASMHFGAIWHEYHGKDAIGYQGDGVNGKHEDLNFATLEGTGIYAGDAITIFNTADAWWGEGDEKVYVDGETFPSHIGTGTEDYIGYAWCRPEYFEHFLIAQPDGSGNFHPGMTVNMRHRLLDCIPFTKSLKFDLELWHWAATKINYGIVSYWYMKPGGKCNIEPNVQVVKEPVSLKRENLYPPVPDLAGYLQGEHLRVVSVSEGNWEVQTSSTWGWSNNAQLWWMDGGLKGSLRAEFEIANEGEYTITGNFTKAVDYGNFRILINDQYSDRQFQGFHTDKEKPVVTQKVALGKFKLNKGINTVQIEITGINPKAVARYMVGIDYLQIRND